MIKIAPITLILLLAICSCSETPAPSPNDDTEAKEIKAKVKSSLDLPEFELFSNARRQYQVGLYSVARESFSAIKDNYPTGPYAEFSELKVADTLFENREYQNAATAYEEFAKNRPASTALPYAILKAGRSYELSSAGIGRDPSPLHKAVETYNSLLQRFPESVYAAAAGYYKRGAEDQLATYEQQVISFYKEKNKLRASAARDREFERRFGTRSTEFEPGNYDKKASLAVSPPSEEAVYEARETLQNLKADGRSTSIVQADIKNYAKPPEGRYFVSALNCNPSENLISLSLSPPPAKELAEFEAIKKGDSIELRISEITTSAEETATYTCFSDGDLTISSNGLITLRTQANPTGAVFVDNPPRIIMNLQ